MDEAPQGTPTEGISTGKIYADEIATKELPAGGFSIEAAPTQPLAPQKRPPKRRLALYSAIALLALAVLLIAGVAIFRNRTTSTGLASTRAQQTPQATATPLGQGGV